jgi:sporulation protein YlmC with PRC-barrel domain
MTTSSLTHDVISSKRVEGTKVYNSAGKRVGSIDHLIIDKRSGQVLYAVMEFGGLVGAGADRYPIPWNMLRYEVGQDGYVTQLEESRLEGAPRHAIDDVPAYDDPYNSSVKAYYGF